MAAPDPASTAWVPLWNTGGAAGGGGGGGGGPHAPTHGIAGGDAVALDAAQIISGVLVRARLPAEVPYTDTINNFTARNDFRALVVFQPTPGAGSPLIYGADPILNFYNTAGPVDHRYFQVAFRSDQVQLWGMTDGYLPRARFFVASEYGMVLGASGEGAIYANGANLTALNASALATGIAAPARLGTGTPTAATFLRGDGVWAVPGGVGVPSGLIAIFDTACPSGWTRVASLDNRFPIGAATYGSAGGDTRHTHGVSGSTGNGGAHDHAFATETDGEGDHSHGYSGQTGDGLNSTMDANNGITQVSRGLHSHSYSGQTGGAGSHSHGVSGRTDSHGGHTHGFTGSTDQVDQWPPYLTVVFCRKD